MNFRFSPNGFVRVALAIGAFMYAGSSAQGAIISIAQANLTSASQVLNTGIYVSGANLYGDIGSAPTVNGVLFKATQNNFYFEGQTNTPGTFRYLGGTIAAFSGIFPGGTLGAPLNELLDSMLYGSNAANMAVVGLNPSTTYRLQLLMSENRGATNYSQNWSIFSGTFTPNVLDPKGTYTTGAAIGSFSVTNLGTGVGGHNAEIVTITFTGYSAINVKAMGGGTQAHLSGMSLFAIVPEPSSMSLIVVGGVMLLSMRKKRA